MTDEELDGITSTKYRKLIGDCCRYLGTYESWVEQKKHHPSMEDVEDLEVLSDILTRMLKRALNP